MRFLSGPPDIPADERKSCIEYYKLELLLKSLAGVEAEKYKNVLAKYGNAVGTDKVAAFEELAKAVKWMSAVARVS